MAISEYLDFVIEAHDFEWDEHSGARYRSQVSSSPAGSSEPEWRDVPEDLERDLRFLEDRRFEPSEIIDFGEKLFSLLLSNWARQLLSKSLRGLAPNQGLRVRLRLPPRLAVFPWEYLYMQREGHRKDITGFLALDPKLSIVRQEASAPATQSDIILEACRLLVVTAEPEDPGLPMLNLSDERFEIADAVRGASGIELSYLKDPSLLQLGDTLLQGTDIFHFAGHGKFEEKLWPVFGESESHGQILLVADEGQPEIVPAEKLTVVLWGNGIQLAVLTSSESARRDRCDAASGLAPSLVLAGIPAVVGMQYNLMDTSTIAFSRSFYRALAAGLPLDRAVSGGRKAILSCPSWNDRGWRDWGGPVLYLQERSLVLQAAGNDWNEPVDDVDRRALLKVLVGKFGFEDLEALCFHIEEDLKETGTDLEVNLQMVGGTGKEAKARGLIDYLDRRDHLDTLVQAVRRARPGSL